MNETTYILTACGEAEIMMLHLALKKRDHVHADVPQISRNREVALVFHRAGPHTS